MRAVVSCCKLAKASKFGQILVPLGHEIVSLKPSVELLEDTDKFKDKAKV